MYARGEQLKASGVISHNVVCTRQAFRYTYARREGCYAKMYDCGEPTELDDAAMSELFDFRHFVRPTWSPGKGDWRFKGNFMAFPSDFADAEWGDIAVRPDAQAFDYGYQAVSFQDIGLRPKTRSRNPVKVLTQLTYPYRTEDKPLTLGLRNTADTAVSGQIVLLTDNPNVILDYERINFSLEPGEERQVKVGNLGQETVFTVEARGVTPGVRPARAVNLMGRWKRF